MTASILTVRDDLDRVCFVADRIAEFSEHNVEFTPLRHLVEKLLATAATLRKDLNTAEMGHLMDGASAVVDRRRPIGLAATGDIALRRGAYIAGLRQGNFEALHHEQELIDPDMAIWRQYVPAAPHRPPHRTRMSIAHRHPKLFDKLTRSAA